MLGWLSLALAAADPADPLASAPTRAWNLVVVGETGGVALEGWLAAHHLDCRESPSPRRTTVHTECAAPDPAAIDELARPGRLERILFARLDDGPVHHVSTDRVFPIPSEATSAYEGARVRLQSVLGPPTRTGDTPGSLDGPLVRATTSWRFADLSVDLTLMRIGGGPVRLTERWDLPGAEAQATERPGSVAAHGAAPPAHARNPHLAD